MSRLLLAVAAACGWLAALFAVWHVGRAFHEGYEEGREETFAELGIAL